MEPNTISHYRILQKLGAGGMGEVYLAEDTKLGRKVALKLLSTELTQNRDRLHRFEQEASTASSLNHPNILTIHEIGFADGHHFIATEFVDGLTLRKRIAGPRLEIREVLDIGMQVASALDEAHGAGIIHRDIKPENIMIRRNGYVKVLDFGLAKLTETTAGTDSEAPTRALVQTDAGTVMGTSRYMSPEQARGKQVDARTDIWSLGVVLYEMVASHVPFEGETVTDVLVEITKTEPPPLARYAQNVPPEFEWIVMKALRKDASERYQTAKELQSDLKKLKQRLEFEAELERSVPPERISSVISGAMAGGGGAVAGSAATAAPAPAASSRTSGTAAAAVSGQSTASVSGAVPTTRASSAEYILTGIKRHKVRAFVVALSVVVLAATAGYLAFFRKSAALTDKDTILLADFVNTTGDAVFDGTLKQALAVQLGQSPFLNIFGDDRVREALRFMGRSPDERVTRDIGREICQRQGLKALLAGSISGLGSHYVITLEAINAQTGDTVAREQAEAETKEQVLKKLGEATTKLRQKLGESLASIQKFDAPIEQDTTSSLEALKAFSLGDQERNKSTYLNAVPFYKRAIELDPNFGMAYARVAVMYSNLGQPQVAAEYARKAFDLRDRVSEREKFYISARYYDSVTREIDKSIETMQLWSQAYPRDYVPHNNLAVQYIQIGQFEKAIEEAREAMRLNPNIATAPSIVAFAFFALNRSDEAKAVLAQALAQRPDFYEYHIALYLIAWTQGDAATMKQQVAWFAGKPVEYSIFDLQSQSAAFAGQLRKARELNQQAVEMAKQHDLKEVAAGIGLGQAITEAVYGNCQRAKDATTNALAIARTGDLLRNSSFALALCGEWAQAQSSIEEQAKLYPTDTLLNVMVLPTTRAAIELSRNNYAQALQLLQSANRYEGGSQLPVRYVRGQAYLGQRAGTEAATDFQYIMDHRGVWPASPLYPVAQLGFARAAALTGDAAKARKAYQDFFALWKDADPDIPILIEAKKEYSIIQSREAIP